MGILNDAIKAFDSSAENYSAAQEILTELTEAAEAQAVMYQNQILNSLRQGIVLGEKK